MPTAFETHARRLRYQALGMACRAKGIETLLMGHHQDDSVETTIWRLATGARRAGLGGIQDVARIPECRGLFGVSESGSSIQLSSHSNDINRNSAQKNASRSNPSSSRIHHPSTSTGVSIATGGILLFRPLLSFPKTRLLATCHENNIPYVTDPTNFDPTLTPRNAIRSLLASNSLPRALQPPRILSLIHSSRELIQTSTNLSNQLLSSRCRILNLNLRTGTMTVQFLEPTTSADS